MTKKMCFSDNGFLVIMHSVLNSPSYDLGRLVEDSLKLDKYICNKNIVPCFEGDLLQVEETREIVLTHQNFFPLLRYKFKRLRNKRLAISLKEALDKVAGYKQKNPHQRVVLCFEPKAIANRKTIEGTVKKLKEYGLNDAYFDSFFVGKLSAVEKANKIYHTDFGRSLHIVGNAGRMHLTAASRKESYDILTVPHTVSLRDIEEPVIYGAVGSKEILENIAAEPDVRGAYIRFKEGADAKGALVRLLNSFTNTRKLRSVV